MNNMQVVVLGIFLFTTPFLMFGAWMFVACRHLDNIESLFSNSPMVIGNRKVYLQAGMLGRMMRTGSISAMLTMQDFSVRRGMLDKEDLSKIPAGLRKSLVCLWLVHLLLFILLALFCVWLKFWR